MKEQSKKQLSIKEDLLFLLVKIGVVIILLFVLLLFVFGIYRCEDNSMLPALKNGDLAFFYRLQKQYQISDVIIVKKEEHQQIRRIVAQAGDEVDITKDGLKVNGYLQQENEIYTETLPYVEGISFPIKLKKDEYFVLGDNRLNAMDSRVYGVIKKDEIKGVLITLLRRRGF